MAGATRGVHIDTDPGRRRMVLFLRRRFFVVHLACVLAASFLCARAANIVVRHELLALAAGPDDLRAPGVEPAIDATNRDFAAASAQNIFDGRRAVAVADLPTTTSVGGWEGAVPTTLRLRLVGTAVFVDEELSIASIVEPARSGDAVMYSINDCAPRTDDPHADAQPCNRIGEAGVVKRIEPERVYFWNDAAQRHEYVAIDEPTTGGGPPVAPAASNDDGAIRRTGQDAYEVRQSALDRALNDLPALARDARIAPAFEDGRIVGFKLFSIRKGSLYTKIGLQNGDVVQRVNGHEITSPDSALAVYAKLKDSPSLSVDVLRRGKATTLRYAIVP